MLAVHAVCKSPSRIIKINSKRTLQESCCSHCVRVRHQLTPEEDFGKELNVGLSFN